MGLRMGGAWPGVGYHAPRFRWNSFFLFVCLLVLMVMDLIMSSVSFFKSYLFLQLNFNLFIGILNEFVILQLNCYHYQLNYCFSFINTLFCNCIIIIIQLLRHLNLKCEF